MNEVRKRFCKSSLPAIVPHGMWVNHRRTSKPFSVRHAPCPGPTCSSRHQLLFQSNSCRVAIDHCSPPFPRFASRSIFLSFPFLSLSLPLFALFSPFSFPFPSWQIWDKRHESRFCGGAIQLGREVKIGSRFLLQDTFSTRDYHDVSVSV